ncbi:MAG: transposase [bacterium]|nr:transposase [bacterium]
MVIPIDIKKQNIQNWLSNKPIGSAYEPDIYCPELLEFTKKQLNSVHMYKRKLPHWEHPGSTYFITFKVLLAMGYPFRLSLLNGQAGNLLASIVEESIWFGFNERYMINAYVIMPDHIHILIQPLQEWTLAKILQGIKGYTSWMINKTQNRKGAFWQPENMDHIIRNNEDWLDKFEYIHQNPVKAGIVEHPEDYPYSSLVTLHSKGRLESLLKILKMEEL